jgi:hypothetical protein
MAEFKNVFIKSKMNKDLDDRLLPQGEYRNAINIQVSKSESSDVGALENVLGNETLIDFESVTGVAGTVVIGYLVSEVRSSIYTFLTTNTLSSNTSGVYDKTAENFIIESIISQGVATLNTILVSGAFLNFWEGAPIYGVNLLENLLFFTDNKNQPRKINIDFAKDDSSYYEIEDTISVAKYMPYTSPVLWQEITQEVIDNSGTPADLTPALGEYQTTMQDVVSEFLPDGTTDNPYEDPLYQGDPDYLEDKFIRFSYRFKFDDGEYSVYAPFTQECFIPQQDGYFLFPGTTDNDNNDMSAAYRSTIVDFMENKVNQLTLLIGLPEVGDPSFGTTNLFNVCDSFKITEIEILFKESNAAAVLVVDTISAAQISAQFSTLNPTNNTFLYKYSGTKPFKTLPENQLVRVYDKVPVKALGQEVISNRVVYSNFQTRHTPPSGIDYNVGAGAKLGFDVTTPATPVSWNTSIVEYPNSTLKQNRNYQAGFVLSDRFGRTTSTLLSNQATVSATTASQLSTVYSAYNLDPADGGPDIGQWPGDALFVQVNDTISETPVASTLYPGTYQGDPSLSTYNPLGFFSWKVVVKQQEQDYYNVYLPGILASYPDDPTKELGLTSHVVLLNDNINKVPRDLSEVGPDQKQFRSSVQLFGRVENTDQAPVGTPSTNFGVVNQQYYPSRFSDTVSTISTEFELFNVDPTTGPSVEQEASFYEVESNPLIARISTTNQIGQIEPVTAGSGYSIFNLAVYETEPVESRLDIYWETSTTGTIADLNEQVEETGGQTIFQTVNFNFDFNEFFGIFDPAVTGAWDPAVQGSPEMPGPGYPACTPSPSNGECGRYRSVLAGPFWFEDTTSTEIVNVIVEGFTVTDGAGVDVTADFEVLQIYGTSSTVPGPGNYIKYDGTTVPSTAYAHDSFLLVNKSYRFWQTSTPNSQEFDIELQVSDASVPTPRPIKVFTYTPLGNGTELDNVDTIFVGGESFSSVPQQWGQNPSATVPAPPIIDYAKVCPPSQVIVNYGLLGTLVKLYATNGANYGNPASVPLSENQQNLQFSIITQAQGGVPVTTLQIDPASGEISETFPGSGTGRYDLKVQVTSPDGTFDVCNFPIIIGQTPADGSFSSGAFSVGSLLFYGASYIYSFHNTITNAFNQLSNSSSSYPGVYPNITSVIVSGSFNNNLQNTFCNSYTAGSGGYPLSQSLQTYQMSGGSGSIGALTQGTAYLWLDVEIFGGPGAFGTYQSCDISWAVEYRPTSTSSWEAAVDIEGNVLSFNSLLSGPSPTNPIQSNTAHIGALANSSSSSNLDQKFGGATTSIGTVGSPSNNFLRMTAQRGASSSSPSSTAVLSKLVAVGESPVYGLPAAFGEYRAIIQSIGGDCFTCQGCNSSGPAAVANFNTFVGELKYGDFYYDLGPQRAFSYQVVTQKFATEAGALGYSVGLPSITLYAREPVCRYVSTFFTGPDLLTPYTGWTNPTNLFVSYQPGSSAGATWTTPLGGTATGVFVKDLAKASETAQYDGASSSTTQNKRTWACQVGVGTGTKIAGTSVYND